MEVPALLFREIGGSMSSNDGRQVFLDATDIDGNRVFLGFPHEQIEKAIESLAMQMDNRWNEDGERVMSAFPATGFQIGKGPGGQPVLIFQVGQAKMSFVLEPEFVSALIEGLVRLVPKN